MGVFYLSNYDMNILMILLIAIEVNNSSWIFWRRLRSKLELKPNLSIDASLSTMTEQTTANGEASSEENNLRARSTKKVKRGA